MKNIIVLFVTIVATAVAVQPGFDPKDVVRRVRGDGREAPGVQRLALDDGEFLVDTSLVIRPAPGSQQDPALAFDGSDFLVVWYDFRSGPNCDIYGARVTPAGALLDPNGTVISTAASSQCNPTVAFNGTNFLVVWQDNRSGSDYDIYAARMTPAGVVLDPSGIVLSQAAGNQYCPAVSCGGTNFLVVWRDSRSSDIYGTRVSRAGVVLDPAGIAISTAAGDQLFPSLAFDGTNFLVVWDDYRSGSSPDVYGARVTPQGTVLDPSGFVISQAAGYQEYPSVAFDGTNFLAVWEDYRDGDTSDIYGARVTPQGTVLDPSGFVISQAAGYQEHPAVAVDGTNLLAVWEDFRSGPYECDIYGARVSQLGAVLDPTGIAISTAANSQYSPAIAFDGTGFLVVWTDERGDPCSDIYGTRVTPQGTVLDPSGLIISQAAGNQRCPASAFDGVNFLVVWQDYRNGDTSDVYGARVTPGGTVLDPQGIAISTSWNGQGPPAVAFDGMNFLAVWEDYRDGDTSDIYGARVTPQGAVLDPQGFAITQAANYQEHPAVAFDGTDFLVVWQDWRSYSKIYGARVTTQGTVLDPQGFAITQAANYHQLPSLGFDGTNFLVVWTEWQGYYDIYGARVTPAGTVLDTSGFVISQAAINQWEPALGFDGANFLVVWQDVRNYPDTSDIYGARVTQAGEVLDPSGIAISAAAYGQYVPALAFDGANFLVVWTDDRSGEHDIYGAWVTRGGVVSDEGPVVRQKGGQRYPVLARGSGSQMLLAYWGWAGIVGGTTYNTDRIWGKVNPAPGIVETRQPTTYDPWLKATIVRGVLHMPPASGAEHEATSVLLDITGRKVLALRTGPNCTRGLAPGVYFVRVGTDTRVRRVILVSR